jgi:hypothetical protein
MGTISVEIDATGSAVGGGNPDGTAYALSTANGYSLLSFDAPEPEQDIQWASSADTEGELAANQRYHNRVVTARFRLAKASDALLEAEFNALSKKIGKLVREGGTLKVTVPSGTLCYLDVVNASHAFTWDLRFLRIQRGEVTLTLPCRPFIRGAEVELGTDTVETTLPYLVKTVTGCRVERRSKLRVVLELSGRPLNAGVGRRRTPLTTSAPSGCTRGCLLPRQTQARFRLPLNGPMATFACRLGPQSSRSTRTMTLRGGGCSSTWGW